MTVEGVTVTDSTGEVAAVSLAASSARTGDLSALLAAQGAAFAPGETEWLEVFNAHGQWKNGEWGTVPPTYSNPTLGDEVFRIGNPSPTPTPTLNGFWPQQAGLNHPAQQHVLDEGIFVPRGFALMKGEFEGLITTHATVQPLFHVQFHASSNVWDLFAADPANLYTQIGAQGNPKFQVPAGISSKEFKAKWEITSAQDVTSGFWAQRYDLEIWIDHVVTYSITAGNGGAATIGVGFRNCTSIAKAANAAGTWDPYAADTNIAIRFGLYRNSGEDGLGSSVLDVRSARAWVGRLPA